MSGNTIVLLGSLAILGSGFVPIGLGIYLTVKLGTTPPSEAGPGLPISLAGSALALTTGVLAVGNYPIRQYVFAPLDRFVGEWYRVWCQGTTFAIATTTLAILMSVVSIDKDKLDSHVVTGNRGPGIADRLIVLTSFVFLFTVLQSILLAVVFRDVRKEQKKARASSEV